MGGRRDFKFRTQVDVNNPTYGRQTVAEKGVVKSRDPFGVPIHI